jgi:endogenous inhibitor of DNA gyrase (YacG/DUF329 family)
MFIRFGYSLRCPNCGESIDSGTDIVFAHSRETILADVYKRHPKCPNCEEPIPEGTQITIREC